MTATATLGEDLVVDLHPLHVGPEEDGEREVGRPDTGVFVSLPQAGVDLLVWLQEGNTVGEVKRRFADTYGEEPDLDDFLAGMAECGFVRGDGNDVIGAAEATTPARGWRLFENVRPDRLGWLRTRTAGVVAAALWMAVPVVLVVSPHLVPSPSDAVVFGSVTPDAIALAVLAWTFVFLHEIGHLLAVRALGCTASLTISHRLHYVVAQTDMTSVRSQPRRARYAAYLAGMTVDVAVLLACFAVQATTDWHVASAIAYLVAFSVAFQFAFFMRTDVYYVVANWLRLGNLMHDTRRWLSNVVGRRHDLTDIPARELRIVKWYAVFCVLAVPAAMAQFVFFGLPVLVRLVGDALRNLDDGPVHASFWDATAFLTLIVAQFGVLAWTIVRDRRA